MKKVLAILCADLHIRSDKPVCRKDDYLVAQQQKLSFIKDLVITNGCPLIVAGDVFHTAKSSPYVEKIALDFFIGMDCIVIPGQHDLPYHRLSHVNQGSYGVLATLNNVEGKIKFHYTELGDWMVVTLQGIKIAIAHIFVPKPNDKQDFAIIGKDYDGYVHKWKQLNVDLVVTGDNHKSFIVQNRSYIHINPGSMMRMTASQENHKPMVVKVYTDLTTEIVYLPIMEGVIDRTYVDKDYQREDRLQAFVKKVSSEYELDIDFLHNLRQFLTVNKVRKGVKDKINQLLEEVVNESNR